MSRLLPSDVRDTALRFGIGRTAIAASVLAAPEVSARLLGADAATARRVTWLTRMMAVRDGALGVGAVRAVRRGEDARPWLVAGAVSDAVDALVIAGSVRRRQIRGPLGAAVVLGAGAASGAGVALVRRLG